MNKLRAPLNHRTFTLGGISAMLTPSVMTILSSVASIYLETATSYFRAIDMTWR